jgi:predicted GIY-YIG superfamily endonuclease
MPKLPGFMFYPGDWLKDPALRRCSKAAKGVWIDAICLLFECEERGIFATDGEAWTLEDIARDIGGDTSENVACLRELLSKKVAKFTRDGAVFSARMVRDERLRSENKTRQRKFRKVQRKKKIKAISRNGAVTDDVTEPVTADVTDDVTALSRPSSFSSSDGDSARYLAVNAAVTKAGGIPKQHRQTAGATPSRSPNGDATAAPGPSEKQPSPPPPASAVAAELSHAAAMLNRPLPDDVRKAIESFVREHNIQPPATAPTEPREVQHANASDHPASVASRTPENPGKSSRR